MDRTEVRYWMGVALSIIGLTVAKLVYGADISWIVVTAPLWAPPVLFFWFAAIAIAIAALAMAGKPDRDENGAIIEWPTARQRFTAWLAAKSGRHNPKLTIAILAAAQAADSAQAATTFLA